MLEAFAHHMPELIWSSLITMTAPHVLLMVLALVSADRASAQQVFPPQDARRQALPPPPLALVPVGGSTLGYPLSSALSPREALSPTSVDSSPVPRVLLEFLFGGTGGVALGVAGFYSGLAASRCSFADGCSSAVGNYLLYGSAIAIYTLGSTLGVYGAGVLMEGRGRWWPTLAGGALGAAAGSAAFIASDKRSAAFILLALSPLASAIIGYELSASFAEPELEPPHALHSMPGPRVVPVIAATPSGGILGGLAGKF
jgi:hypothetical protein